MTIEQFAAQQELPDITRYKVRGVSVYRLQNKKDDGRIGIPVFALETRSGYRLASYDEVFRIMHELYGED